MSPGKFFAWVSRDVSRVIQVVVIGYISIYATSALHMNAALVGTLLMVSRIVDGITDLIAGYIVDNTKSRLGKGRPYELFIIGLWFFTWLCFSVPGEASVAVKSIWIVLAYTVAQSICLTFLNANGTVYMVRAFANKNHYVTLSSIGGLITMIGIIIFNIIFPQLTAKVQYDAAGWSRLMLFLAVPMTIIGLMRFLFVKETVNVDASVGTGHITLKDILTVCKKNKYIWIVALIYFFAALFTGMNASSYYCTVMYGDTSMAGILSVFSVVAVVTMVFYPLLMKKLTVKQLIMVSLIFNLPAGVLFFAAKGNLAMLAVATAIGGIASLPLSYMANLMIIDCATYNEYVGLQRMEGTLNAVTGFANKIGSAVAVFVVGILLSVAGYDGTLGVNEPASAKAMITFLVGGIPVITSVVLWIALSFYKLDKDLPEYTRVVEERRKEAVNEAV